MKILSFFFLDRSNESFLQIYKFNLSLEEEPIRLETVSIMNLWVRKSCRKECLPGRRILRIMRREGKLVVCDERFGRGLLRIPLDTLTDRA